MALHWTHWGSYFEKIICNCLGSSFSKEATTVGSPPNFSKLISQPWGITESYFITLSLDLYWTYFWKHYIYKQKDTKFGSQNFGYQIWFSTRLLIKSYCPNMLMPYGHKFQKLYMEVVWWMYNLTNEKSTLVQVMACRRMATSHYLSQCWSISMLPHGVT